MWNYLFSFHFSLTRRTKQFSFNSSLSVFHKRGSIFRETHSTKEHKHVGNKMHDCLPFCAKGEIVKGFGRGSKELGIPTANYPLEVVKNLPAALQTGIYYGWANIDNGEVHKMVMSIGWNPFYDNTEKSMETHIMHEFNRDLYGCLLKVCIVGYIRPEKNFTSLDDLIAAINDDIAQAKTLLETDANALKMKDCDFFHKENTESYSTNGSHTSNDS